MTDKTKKQALESLIGQQESEIFVLQLKEKFLQQKILAGDSKFENNLGQVQAQIKGQEEYLNFLRQEYGNY